MKLMSTPGFQTDAFINDIRNGILPMNLWNNPDFILDAFHAIRKNKLLLFHENQPFLLINTLHLLELCLYYLQREIGGMSIHFFTLLRGCAMNHRRITSHCRNYKEVIYFSALINTGFQRICMCLYRYTDCFYGNLHRISLMLLCHSSSLYRAIEDIPHDGHKHHKKESVNDASHGLSLKFNWKNYSDETTIDASVHECTLLLLKTLKESLHEHIKSGFSICPFGSAVNGLGGKDSDIDITIVFEKKVYKEVLVEAMRRFREEFESEDVLKASDVTMYISRDRMSMKKFPKVRRYFKDSALPLRYYHLCEFLECLAKGDGSEESGSSPTLEEAEEVGEENIEEGEHDDVDKERGRRRNRDRGVQSLSPKEVLAMQRRLAGGEFDEMIKNFDASKYKHDHILMQSIKIEILRLLAKSLKARKVLMEINENARTKILCLKAVFAKDQATGKYELVNAHKLLPMLLPNEIIGGTHLNQEHEIKRKYDMLQISDGKIKGGTNRAKRQFKNTSVSSHAAINSLTASDTTAHTATANSPFIPPPPPTVPKQPDYAALSEGSSSVNEAPSRPSANNPCATATSNGQEVSYVFIDADISIGNTLTCYNSLLLRTYCMIDSRIGALVYLVKRWAKSHKMNSAFDGYLSSYAWCLLAIHFLQHGVCEGVRKRSVAPCLQVDGAGERGPVGEIQVPEAERIDGVHKIDFLHPTLGWITTKFNKFLTVPFEPIKHKHRHCVNTGTSDCQCPGSKGGKPCIVNSSYNVAQLNKIGMCYQSSSHREEVSKRIGCYKENGHLTIEELFVGFLQYYSSTFDHFGSFASITGKAHVDKGAWLRDFFQEKLKSDPGFYFICDVLSVVDPFEHAKCMRTNNTAHDVILKNMFFTLLQIHDSSHNFSTAKAFLETFFHVHKNPHHGVPIKKINLNKLKTLASKVLHLEFDTVLQNTVSKQRFYQDRCQ